MGERWSGGRTFEVGRRRWEEAGPAGGPCRGGDEAGGDPFFYKLLLRVRMTPHSLGDIGGEAQGLLSSHGSSWRQERRGQLCVTNVRPEPRSVAEDLPGVAPATLALGVTPSRRKQSS